MSDEQKEARINIEDLPKAEQELTEEEAKDVKGGAVSGSTVWTGTIRLDTNATIG